MRSLVFVADHRPDAGHRYRYVRRRGLERAVAGMTLEDRRAHLARVGHRENIPHGKGRTAALRRARG